MNKLNFIDEEFLVLERPDIRQECNIKSDEQMEKYLIFYNVYSNLLVQYMIKKYDLLEYDKRLEDRKELFGEVPNEDKDMYQYLSNGYLKYFYIRNNIYVERFNKKQLDYLWNIYKTDDYTLTYQNEKFVEDTYKDIILEIPNGQVINISYGPDNGKFYKPSNSIIIGVRYNQFSNELGDTFSNFSSALGQINLLTSILEYGVEEKIGIPFNVIIYDEFSVHCKKKVSQKKS